MDSKPSGPPPITMSSASLADDADDGAPGPEATESTPLLLNQSFRNEASPSCNVDPADVNRMTVFWEEMLTIPRYTVPIFGASIVEYSLIFVPVISVGHISTLALAAISLGSMTSGVTGYSIFQGLGSALDTLLPATWTSSQPHLMGLWAQRMWVVMIIASIPISSVWLHAEPILLAMKQDPEVARLAAAYLRWSTLGLPAYTFNLISRRYFQSQGLLSLQTWIIMFVAPINVAINYLLVWGPESIRLGFIGAPIATVISFYIVSFASLLFGIYYVPRKAWHPISSQMFTNLGLVTRLGLSGIGQVASAWWAWDLGGLAASLLGPIALASQSILLTSSTIIFQAGLSLAQATTIRVGNILGEKKAGRAEVAMRTAFGLALFMNAFMSTLLATFRHSLAHIFNDDPEVVRMVAGVVPIIALYKLLDGVASVTAGILRVKGDQHIGAVLNVSAYYIIGIPLGIWLAFSWDMGLHGIWIGLSVAVVYSAVVGTYLSLKTDWDCEVKKVVERMEEEERLKKRRDEEGSFLRPSS